MTNPYFKDVIIVESFVVL